MYIDYRKDEIKDLNNLKGIISRTRNIKLEVIDIYFKKYNSIPYILFSDDDDINFSIIEKRLLLIHRKLKIDKLHMNKK